MQGSGGGLKWSTNVLNTILNRGGDSSPDILAIQEGGAGPGYYRNGMFVPITGVSQLPEPGTSNSPVPADISGFNFGHPEIVEFRWNIRGIDEPYYVYGVMSDLQSNGSPGRVNSYIVSRQRADEIVLRAHRFQDSVNGVRPHFGIRIGTSYFFSVHSISSNAAAADTAYRLNEIEQYVRARGARYDWAAMGDFNADPANVYLQMAAYPDLTEVETVHTGRVTQTSGGELDYMFFRDVVGAAGGNIPSALFFAAIISMYNSDHFPVRFW